MTMVRIVLYVVVYQLIWGLFCFSVIVGGGGVVMVWMCMFTYTVWEVGHTSE